MARMIDSQTGLSWQLTPGGWALEGVEGGVPGYSGREKKSQKWACRGQGLNLREGIGGGRLGFLGKPFELRSLISPNRCSFQKPSHPGPHYPPAVRCYDPKCLQAISSQQTRAPLCLVPSQNLAGVIQASDFYQAGAGGRSQGQGEGRRFSRVRGARVSPPSLISDKVPSMLL